MRRIELWLGLGAIVGSMTVGISDLVLSGMPISGAEHVALGLKTAQGKSATALQWAGFAGVGNLLVALGVLQWYRAMRPAGRRWALPPTVCLMLFFLLGVTVHFIWPIVATTYLALPAPDDPAHASIEALYLTLRNRYFLPLGIATFLFLLAGSLGFAAALLTGRTRLPRWFALCTPALPVFLLYQLAPHVPAPIGGYLRANFLHLIVPVVFALSTWLLSREAAEPDTYTADHRRHIERLPPKHIDGR